MNNLIIQRWGVFVLWLLLSATVFFRHPVPIDETRYLSVAWEMWLRGDFLVPYLNGATYSHKPPLLFWLFQLGWGVFGINEWWPRWVGPLCALCNLILIRQLASKLWSTQTQAALLAPWILVATLLWAVFASATMFDVLLTCCVLLAMLGLLEAVEGKALKGWIYLASAMGLGLLAKGPVIFLHVLPTALLFVGFYPLANGRKFNWFMGFFFAVLLGVIFALAWAIPAAIAGGEDYAGAILWHQTADRAVATSIHKRGVWWYLPFLPLLMFPWLFWSRIWPAVKWSRFRQDRGLGFCTIWLVAGLVIFSLLPSKQIHYLIPLMPAYALIVARLLADLPASPRQGFEWLLPGLLALIGLLLVIAPQLSPKWLWLQAVRPAWGISVLALAGVLTAWWFVLGRLSVISIATTLVVTVMLSFIFFFHYNDAGYNLQPAADKLTELRIQNRPVVYVGNYQGQLNFLARLEQPLPTLTLEQVSNWATQHPDGYFISLEKQLAEDADFAQGHREYWLLFRPASQFNLLKPL